MSQACENINPLMRDGTSQQQRLLQALLPSYVSVDERSMEDLVQFANEYAELINYYDDQNTVDGDWTPFFDGQNIDTENAKTQPHYALFIAFLEIFRIAQNDLNTITQRHLEFYYEEVLQIQRREAIPDQVFVIFELAQQLSGQLVEQGTELDAGEDNSGTDQVYITNSDIVVNHSQATQFKALFYNKENDDRLYASPVANSANGEGTPIETEEPSWKTFGAISNPTSPFTDADRPQADTGFAFASPVLLMNEGNRSVEIKLTFQGPTGLSNSELTDAFDVYFSGEEEWILPEQTTSKSPQDATYISGTNSIIIRRTITEGQPSVVPYSPDVLEDPIDTAWPVAKVLLNHDYPLLPFIYEKLKGLVVTNVEVNVTVTNVKNVVVQNDQSVLDSSKPFEPFGSQPVITSSFYVGSQEVFSKQLETLAFNITWKGLPKNKTGFKGYYHNYIPADQNTNRTNTGFKARVSVLNDRSWNTIIPETSNRARLFSQVPPPFAPVVTGPFGGTSFISFSFLLDRELQSFRKISVTSANNGSLTSIPRDPEIVAITEFRTTTEKGFARLQLQNADFGHDDYQVSFATKALRIAKSTSTTVSDNDLPNPPYTPEISELSLDYTSGVSLNLVSTPLTSSEQNFDNRVEQFFHIAPFGAAERHPFSNQNSTDIRLVPTFNDEGTLYVGFENMVVPQNLSMLVKVAEGSANPDLPVQTVVWSYLVNNEWFEFTDQEIIADGTNGLLNSGVIKFRIPKTLTDGNSILPSGLHWIKAAVQDESGAVSDIISIQTQAETATFVDNNNDPSHFDASLPDGSISSFVNSQDGITSVNQPYASFGGNAAEDSTSYFIRVSERLRHKNRAVNIWDYERLVLEKFPNVYKVKCINHTKYVSVNDINELSPGDVSLGIVSNLRNQNAVNLLEPKTSLATLNEIHEFIDELNPPCANLFVKNPIFEQIKVHFKVRFRQGFDPGFYSNQLNQDIIEFLSPWAFETAEIFFGGRIEGSVILNFIEEQPYVDYLTCYRMDHITPGGTDKNIDVAIASTSASILTSVSNHDIIILQTDDCECEDNIVTTDIRQDDCPCDNGETSSQSGEDSIFGVGSSEVGENFVVGDGSSFGKDGVGSMEIGNDFEIE